jgi:uncharacterized protein (TIGR03067 family)
MKRVWLVALVVWGVGAWGSLGAWAGEPVKAEAEQAATQIRGLWRGVSVEHGYMTLPEAAARQLVFAITEKTIAMRMSGKLVAETSYRLDVRQEPAVIELTYQGEPTHGICTRSGSTLKICLTDVEKSRPKKFSIGGEGGRMLFVFTAAEEEYPLYAMDIDGTNRRRIVAKPDYTALGSPDWSRDGKRLAYDTWRPAYGETYREAHVFVANADGSECRDLGDGAMPSWSPDGKRLGMSRYSPNYGVWIMNADGTGKELVDEGWSIEWCPKGNRVAYTTYRDGANILVRDLGKGEGRTLLDKDYRQIYWGMAWSPDGQWIAFKGITPDGKAELAAVHVDGQSKGFKILLPKAMPDVKDILWASAWGGDGKRLIASLVGPKGGPRQLYFLDFAEKEPPQLVPGQDPTWANSEMAWSADGKKLAFRAMPPKSPAAK